MFRALCSKGGCAESEQYFLPPGHCGVFVHCDDDAKTGAYIFEKRENIHGLYCWVDTGLVWNLHDLMPAAHAAWNVHLLE